MGQQVTIPAQSNVCTFFTVNLLWVTSYCINLLFKRRCTIVRMIPSNVFLSSIHKCIWNWFIWYDTFYLLIYVEHFIYRKILLKLIITKNNVGEHSRRVLIISAKYCNFMWEIINCCQFIFLLKRNVHRCLIIILISLGRLNQFLLRKSKYLYCFWLFKWMLDTNDFPATNSSCLSLYHVLSF